jgi:hypothetical protein
MNIRRTEAAVNGEVCSRVSATESRRPQRQAHEWLIELPKWDGQPRVQLLVSQTGLLRPGLEEHGEPMFAVVAKRWGGLFMVSAFSSQERAEIALAENTDRHPLFVVPAEVWFAPNGNVRLWKSAQLESEQ